MAWKCIVEGKELADVRADRKDSESILVTALRAQPSLYYPQCCCGRGVPVFKIRLDYGAEKPLILMVEKEKSAEKIVAAIRAANPAVTVEEYVDPNGGEKT